MSETVAVWSFQGESAILVRFDGPLEKANVFARVFRRTLRKGFPEIEEIVPGARTVLLRLTAGAAPSSALLSELDRLDSEKIYVADLRTSVSIPVSYGGEDLRAVADETGLTPREIVALHASTEYVVAFIGFMPGFPYLLGLPQRLHVPRLRTPRSRVPAGSVAIAGAFTGIYPSPSPGGWRIIGHSEFRLFDAGAPGDPARLRPGHRVRFIES